MQPSEPATDRGTDSTKPWYRHRWTWGLMAGPFIVLVAGAITTTIAIRTDDGLVARDYYKRGLMINKVLQQANAAAEHARTACAAAAATPGERACRND